MLKGMSEVKLQKILFSCTAFQLEIMNYCTANPVRAHKAFGCMAWVRNRVVAPLQYINTKQRMSNWNAFSGISMSIKWKFHLC